MGGGVEAKNSKITLHQLSPEDFISELLPLAPVLFDSLAPDSLLGVCKSLRLLLLLRLLRLALLLFFFLLGGFLLSYNQITQE